MSRVRLSVHIDEDIYIKLKLMLAKNRETVQDYIERMIIYGLEISDPTSMKGGVTGEKGTDNCSP